MQDRPHKFAVIAALREMIDHDLEVSTQYFGEVSTPFRLRLSCNAHWQVTELKSRKLLSENLGTSLRYLLGEEFLHEAQTAAHTVARAPKDESKPPMNPNDPNFHDIAPVCDTCLISTNR